MPCIFGKRSSKRKWLALNAFKAAVKAPAATRLCPEPRNAFKDKVALSATSWQLPQRWSLLNEKAANLSVIASQFIGEGQKLKLLFFLDCFVASLLAMTTGRQ